MRVEVESAATDAMNVVDAFLAHHKQAAIPALIGACVMWAVDNGGREVVKKSLKNAMQLADDMEAARQKEAQ